MADEALDESKRKCYSLNKIENTEMSGLNCGRMDLSNDMFIWIDNSVIKCKGDESDK